jgi:hypothetical protein
MTFQEKQQAMLADLFVEYNTEGLPMWWQMRLAAKIAELRAAMGDENA